VDAPASVILRASLFDVMVDFEFLVAMVLDVKAIVPNKLKFKPKKRMR
jgi:hypothetical protein